MSDKKFANLHYPGINVDPNEGKTPIAPSARWRFAEQIECIGEETQQKLLNSSALVIGASPLGTRLARNLVGMGIGRVGVIGEELATGAQEVAEPTASAQGGDTSAPSTCVLSSLSQWAKAEAPWAKLETFSGESMDRRLFDVVRGFEIVISAGDFGAAKQALTMARTHKLPALLGGVAGKTAWMISVPKDSVCEDCLPEPGKAPGAGLFFPLLEFIATTMAALAVDPVAEPFFEGIDANHAPWRPEHHKMKSRANCSKCQVC